MSTPDGTKVLDIHGRYYEASQRGNLFVAHAIVTAPVVYTTEAGTGGPLLWNGSGVATNPGAKVKANILAVGFGVTTVTTVAAALGFTGGDAQTAAPTTTTAIDSTSNLLIGGDASRCTAYRVGTTVENKFFIPFAHVHTGALTVDTTGVQWIDFGGMITVEPDSFVSIAASATASTLVASISLIWEEVPV
jgi:hypothetical protein